MAGKEQGHLAIGEPAPPGRVSAHLGFSFADGVAHRVHRSYVFLGPTVGFAAFLLVVLNSAQGLVRLVVELVEEGDGPPVALVAVAVLLVLALLYAAFIGFYAVSYRHISYVFDEREFTLRSGVLMKKQVHVPYGRVQSVNQKAGVLQRIVGVCTVTIDTAGGAQNKAVRVPYVTLADAERIRSDLFLRKAAELHGVQVVTSGAAVAVPGVSTASAPSKAHAPMQGAAAPVPPSVQVTGGQAFDDTGAANVLEAAVGDVADWRGLFGGAVEGLEPITCELGLSNRELLFASVSHTAPLVAALILGLAMSATFLPLTFSFGIGVAAAVGFAVLVTVGSMLVSWALMAAGMAVSYGKFRVRRRGSRVEVERGLLQRSFSGIDVSRIQSVEIRQTFVRRILGYCEISLGRVNARSGEASGGQNSKQQSQGLVVHPFAKVDDAPRIVAQLLPEYAGMPGRESLAPLPKPAMRRCLLRRCVWFNAALYVAVAMLAALAVVAGAGEGAAAVRAVAALAGVTVLACAAITAVLAASAVLYARESGYAWNRGFVTLFCSGLGTKLVCIPRQKVQCAGTRANPFQRRLGLATIVAVTAAGSGSTVAQLRDVTQDAGDAWLTWLKPHCGETGSDLVGAVAFGGGPADASARA